MDAKPTSEERPQIEASLRPAGYVTWEEIESDEGMWEVDDARKDGDCREFYLKLDSGTFRIVNEREDG